jgi:hypothetical protein
LVRPRRPHPPRGRSRHTGLDIPAGTFFEKALRRGARPVGATAAAVGRHGSVTEAAKELHYTQPAASHHLARLEATTGAKRR